MHRLLASQILRCELSVARLGSAQKGLQIDVREALVHSLRATTPHRQMISRDSDDSETLVNRYMSSFYRYVFFNVTRAERDGLENLNHRANTVIQYIDGINWLSKSDEKLSPLDCRWVSDDFTGSGEGCHYLSTDDPCTLICARQGST